MRGRAGDPVVIHVARLGSDALVIVLGEIARSSVDRLSRSLRDAADGGTEHVVVDASGLRSIDLVGALALRQAASELSSRGGTMRVVDPPPMLAGFLDDESTVALEPAPWARTREGLENSRRARTTQRSRHARP